MKKPLSLLLALVLLIGLAIPGAFADEPIVLTVFDFTEELNQELINEAPTIKKMEEELGVDLQIEVVSGISN